MSLESLLAEGAVYKIEGGKALVERCLRISARDLRSAKQLLQEENFDWTLAVAYNSMLQACRALMFLKGYRPSAEGGHRAVVEFMKAVHGKEFGEEKLRYFDKLRRKRHTTVYEEPELISEAEAKYAIEEAQAFLEKAKKLAGL